MPITKPIVTNDQGKGLSGAVAETAPAPVSTTFRPTTPPPSKGRDFDAEARGKVACVAFNAALASPGIAGLGFTNFDEYMAYVRRAADMSVAYTWEKQK